MSESGAPGRIRTHDPQIRSLVLYPAELPVLPGFTRHPQTRLISRHKPSAGYRPPQGRHVAVVAARRKRSGASAAQGRQAPLQEAMVARSRAVSVPGSDSLPIRNRPAAQGPAPLRPLIQEPRRDHRKARGRHHGRAWRAGAGAERPLQGGHERLRAPHARLRPRGAADRGGAAHRGRLRRGSSASRRPTPTTRRS